MRRYVVKLRPAYGPESCGVIFKEMENAERYIKNLHSSAKTGNLGAVIYSMVDPKTAIDIIQRVGKIPEHDIFTVVGKTCEEVAFISFTSPSIARPA